MDVVRIFEDKLGLFVEFCRMTRDISNRRNFALGKLCVAHKLANK